MTARCVQQCVRRRRPFGERERPIPEEVEVLAPRLFLFFVAAVVVAVIVTRKLMSDEEGARRW
jgi:hypothetical protein